MTTIAVHESDTATVLRARRMRARVVPGAMGIAAGATIAIGAGIPSFWGDEAASVMSAVRPLPSLMAELSWVDAVHGLYYLLLHAWIDLVGSSEFAVRLPSAVAAGFAVAGTVVLGRYLFGLRVGVASGIVLAVMPTFTRLGIEARSYALGIAAVVWLTVLLVALVARRRPLRRMWVLYAAGWTLAIWLWVFLAIALAVHLAFLVALRARRHTLRRWLVAVAWIAALIAPIGVFVVAQRDQVAFLAERGYATPFNVLVAQWFQYPPFAICAWALVVVGIVAAARMQPARRRRALAVALWAFGPTVLILVVGATVITLYNPRYLAFSMPAVAILAGLGATALPRWACRRAGGRRAAGAAVAVLVLVALLASAAPRFVAQRSPYGKGGADLRQVAETLAQRSSPGDAVVFDRTIKPSQRPRPVLHLYPRLTAGLDDVALKTPYEERSRIWDSSYRVADVADRLDGHPVVWAVEVRGSGSPDLAALRRLDYEVTWSRTLHRTTVYRLQKETP